MGYLFATVAIRPEYNEVNISMVVFLIFEIVVLTSPNHHHGTPTDLKIMFSPRAQATNS